MDSRDVGRKLVRSARLEARPAVCEEKRRNAIDVMFVIFQSDDLGGEHVTIFE